MEALYTPPDYVYDLFNNVENLEGSKDYETWAILMLSFFGACEVEGIVLGEEKRPSLDVKNDTSSPTDGEVTLQTPPNKPNEEIEKAIKIWDAKNRFALGYMVFKTSNRNLMIISRNKTAREAWKLLKLFNQEGHLDDF
jgi:hypothetical protein